MSGTVDEVVVIAFLVLTLAVVRFCLWIIGERRQRDVRRRRARRDS
jgi:hypothetical protein